MLPMRDERTTSEDRATQLLICEPLSLAIALQNQISPVQLICPYSSDFEEYVLIQPLLMQSQETN